MPTKKVLVTEAVHEVLLEGLASMGFEYTYEPGISQEAVQQAIHRYDGLIVATRISVDKQILQAAKQLKFIARAGSGMENIDRESAAEQSVVCINSPEGNANAVGEHAVGLLLAFYHNIVKADAQLREAKWLVEENRVHELEGRTVGIIGYGNTGRSFAKKLQPFNVRVIAYDKYLDNFTDQFAHAAMMQQLFEDAEIISMHVPLNNETWRMADLHFFQQFRKQIFFINTSRGKVVDHKTLLQLIQQNRISGAALDVYENEQFQTHSQEERETFNALMDTGKVIMTPHVAGKSYESKRKIAEVLLAKIKSIT